MLYIQMFIGCIGIILYTYGMGSTIAHEGDDDNELKHAQVSNDENKQVETKVDSEVCTLDDDDQLNNSA